MASEQLVLAVIRAAPPPPPSFTDEAKVAFAVHATFATVGYVVHSIDEIWSGKLYYYGYSKPEMGNRRVIMQTYGIDGTLTVEVANTSSPEHYYLTLTVAEYIKIVGTPYASHFKNLGKLVEQVNEEILNKLDVPPAAISSNQPSSLAARVIVVSDNEDSPRIGRSKEGDHYLSRSAGSRLGFNDPDNHNARNNGISIPSYSRYVVPQINVYGAGDGLFPEPGAGTYPSRGNGGSGSMHVGPNDLMFFGHGTSEPNMSGSPLDVPPGAHFDPYGPSNVRGFQPHYLDRNPPSPGRGVHPDVVPFHKGPFF